MKKAMSCFAGHGRVICWDLFGLLTSATVRNLRKNVTAQIISVVLPCVPGDGIDLRRFQLCLLKE